MAKERFTLDGWEFWKWFKGNGKTIKEIAKVVIPAFVGWVATANPTLTGLATLAGKFILDVLDYYLKQD